MKVFGRKLPSTLSTRLHFSTSRAISMENFGTSVPPLCSPSWLSSQLKSSQTRIIPIDASWHMPASTRNAKKEFSEISIENSRFFDIDLVSDSSDPSPHMLPNPAHFSEYISSLGILQDDHVVIYDSIGIFSSCRVFWTFKIFGHKKISLLNGGLARWIKEGFPTMKGVENPELTAYYPKKEINRTLIKSYSDIITILKNSGSKTLIVDARSKERFLGKAPEPRPEIQSGHMPKSVSLPFNEVLDKVEVSKSFTKFKAPEVLQSIFKNIGIKQGDSVVFSCGTGVTACVLDFALNYGSALNEDQIPQSDNHNQLFKTSVYDGSWTEYATKKESIILKDV